MTIFAPSLARPFDIVNVTDVAPGDALADADGGLPSFPVVLRVTHGPALSLLELNTGEALLMLTDDAVVVRKAPAGSW